MSDDHVLTGLAEEAVRALAHQLATQARGTLEGRVPRGDGDSDLTPTATHDPGHEAPTELDRLRALSYLSRAVERCAREQAAVAARAGANYPQLGDAWGITRQGARRRWPGLLFTAQPPSRPLPSPQHRSSAVNAFSLDRPYSVLLVEDDLADALLIEEALVGRGMARTISRVPDGLAALEHLRDPREERPDLIVLDLNMPRMNGRELLAVLKDDAALGTIPVVVLTTSAAPDDIKDAYRQHANAYVAKPVNLDEFITAVQGIDAFFLDTATLPRP
ncbi:response regulator [Streptomyces sp. NPDC006638]|uniref:response regulator n=1 Tax=Streptomyces sp. NPDC006638 TaxID=3157183 RepID=UPI0033A81725